MMRLVPCLLVVLVACSDLTEPQGSRPASGRSVGAAPEPVAEPEEEAEPDPWADDQPTRTPTVPEPTPEPTAAAAAPEDKERDLDKELVAAMRSATSCLKPRKEGSAPKVSIALSAQVMPSGAVLRGSVSGGGLDGDETKCLQARLEQVRFAGPVEGAPRGAAGTLELELRPIAKTP